MTDPTLPQIGDLVDIRVAVEFGRPVWHQYRVCGPEAPRIGPNGGVWFRATRTDPPRANATPMPMSVAPALLRAAESALEPAT
jgi:hypothetical protein